MCCKSSALDIQNCTNSVTHCKQGSFEWRVDSVTTRGVFSQSVFRWTFKHPTQLSVLLVLLLSKSIDHDYDSVLFNVDQVQPSSRWTRPAIARTLFPDPDVARRFAIPIETKVFFLDDMWALQNWRSDKRSHINDLRKQARWRKRRGICLGVNQ